MKVYVVIPNWNGVKRISACLDSLAEQIQDHAVVVAENGSKDGSVELIESKYPDVELIKHKTNEGFTGGVNAGIKLAMQNGAKYIALLNNDAVAERNWLKELMSFLDANPKAGIVTSKICDSKKTHLDSTGDIYTSWGLPYPRGRGEAYSEKYDKDTWIFGASGGASLYRTSLFEAIGIFDNDYFAYYEDVDISFRAQLAGWKIGYQPKALVYHEIGATSGTIKGFTTYQTMKNLPMLILKNVPHGLFWRTELRFELAYWSFFFSALLRGQGWPAFKGFLAALCLTPKKLWQRRKIQKNRKVTTDYIRSIIVHDLPPNARRLRNLRASWWRLRGKAQ